MHVSLPGQSPGTPTRQNWVVVIEHFPRFELSGVHGTPSTFGPLQTLVVGLQTGHGWMAGSFRHAPPGQLALVTHEKPAMPPVVAALHRLGMMSPPRVMS